MEQAIAARTPVSVILKDYFRLEEVAEEFGLSASDIIYLAENGRLRLSTLVYGLQVERGCCEQSGPGDWQPIPESRETWTGLLDLANKDAHAVLKLGSAEVHSFHEVEGRYCSCWGPIESITVTTRDLLVRSSERLHLASEIRRACEPSGAGRGVSGFSHQPDYRIVRLDGELYSLGPYQAAVIRILHEAAMTGRPWCKGVDILAEIECSTLRMSDLFKSKRGWRKLIDSNARGMYRLTAEAQRSMSE